MILEMRNPLGAVVGIIAIIIAFIMFPMVLDSMTDIKTDVVTQGFANMTTGANETEAVATLSLSLYDDTVLSVDDITSNKEADYPVAQSYSKATKQLTIGGLVENSTRVLMVDYKVDGLTDYTGIATMAGIAPFLIFIGLLVGGGLGIWSGFRR